MVIMHRQPFIKGLAMMMVFLAMLALMFFPIFQGENAFYASDRLFNSIAKGSTHYVPALLEESEQYHGKSIAVSLEVGREENAQEMAMILRAAGVNVKESPGKFEIQGNLGTILKTALQDADDMFFNRGANVSSRHGMGERRALYAWWRALKGIERGLRGQELFNEAAFVDKVVTRGIEVGYNFYTIEPGSATSKASSLSFSLIFYVLYTLWWGFAIFYLMEGLGLQLTAGVKKEV